MRVAEAPAPTHRRNANPTADRVGGVAPGTPVDSFRSSEPQSDGGLTLSVASGEAQLAAVEYSAADAPAGFPFDVPSIAALTRVDFDTPVTILVGENGTGKSTFLEAVAIAAQLPAVGSAGPGADPTLEPQRRLAARLRLTWRGRTRRGFFLRAEDFFGFQKQLAVQRAEHEAELARIDVELAEASDWARGLAKGPHRASLGAMEQRYGPDPDGCSHGEAFLNLFRERLVPAGLYLLDEPEAALSPQSQLAFLAMLRDAVAEGSQVVVATHSPILMAVPGARILSFDEPPVRAVPFGELESVALVRNFLLAPERYLRMIWEGGA